MTQGKLTKKEVHISHQIMKSTTKLKSTATLKIYPLLVESLDHMELTPSKKEFAKAVLRAAIEYACARQAGFVFVPDKPGGQKWLKNHRGAGRVVT